VKDIGTTPQTDSPDRDVVNRLVARRQQDADLAYVIGVGTETYDLLHRALVARGLDAATATARLRCQDTRTARLVEYRERVEQLEAYLDAHCPNWRDDMDGAP